MENWKLQLTAIEALSKKYGFCPAPQQVTLLESDGEGSYILFRVGEHEYRCENGEITNIEDQKKLDEDVSFYLGMVQKSQMNAEKAKEQFEADKEFMKRRIEHVNHRWERQQRFCNEQRLEIHRLKEEIKSLQSPEEYSEKDVLIKVNEHENAQLREIIDKKTKRLNEQRFEIHRMKDQIRKLEPIINELMKITRE